MKKGKDVPEPRPVAAMLQRRADARLREIASNSDVAERHVFEELGEVALANLRALSPERRAATALGVFERLCGGMSADDARAWLAIKVQEQRFALERKATAASETDAGRRRGGAASVAKRQALWDEWRNWIFQYFGARLSADDRRSIVDVIVFRAGARTQEPKLNKNVPDTLPVLGRRGKPPSDDSIGRNLFNTRAK
jgi:hypothetical protein